MMMSKRAGDSRQQRALPGGGKPGQVWWAWGRTRGAPWGEWSPRGAVGQPRQMQDGGAMGHGEVCRAAVHTMLDLRLRSESLAC